MIDGQLHGTVVLPGGSTLTFANASELERCLELGPERLVLIEQAQADDAAECLAALSPTELAIARAALKGASNREIAGALFYSVKSVEAYLTRVYRRLGIEGRNGLSLVAAAIEDLAPPREQADLVAGGSAMPAHSTPASRWVAVELLVV